MPVFVSLVNEYDGAPTAPAIPRASPVEMTWKRSPLPTVKRAAGEVSPMPTLPAKYPAPATEKACDGDVLPNPTLELVVSKVSIGMADEDEVAMEKAFRAVGRVEVDELA